MSDDLVKRAKASIASLQSREVVRNGSWDASELRQSPEWVAASILVEMNDRIEQLESALRDIADGMGEESLTEIGRYAPVIARKALAKMELNDE